MTSTARGRRYTYVGGVNEERKEGWGMEGKEVMLKNEGMERRSSYRRYSIHIKRKLRKMDRKREGGASFGV